MPCISWNSAHRLFWIPWHENLLWIRLIHPYEAPAILYIPPYETSGIRYMHTGVSCPSGKLPERTGTPFYYLLLLFTCISHKFIYLSLGFIHNILPACLHQLFFDLRHTFCRILHAGHYLTTVTQPDFATVCQLIIYG